MDIEYFIEKLYIETVNNIDKYSDFISGKEAVLLDGLTKYVVKKDYIYEHL